ncbi:M15 family metallopeptidase [Leptospira sp. WS58.C1]|uniref:M15 family metallopeptidase n=1 Tax=Leptospira cinconiae TaxID=3235173 RepID=UPI00349EB1B7
MGECGPLRIEGVDRRLLDFFQDLKKELPTAHITSGFRTKEEQTCLYKKMPPGMAAKPGTSSHESGRAIDIGGIDYTSKELRKTVTKVLGKHPDVLWGYYFKVSDPVHFYVPKTSPVWPAALILGSLGLFF